MRCPSPSPFHSDVGQRERHAVVDPIADDGHLQTAFLELPNRGSFGLGGYSRSPLVQAERFGDVPGRAVAVAGQQHQMPNAAHPQVVNDLPCLLTLHVAHQDCAQAVGWAGNPDPGRVSERVKLGWYGRWLHAVVPHQKFVPHEVAVPVHLRLDAQPDLVPALRWRYAWNPRAPAPLTRMPSLAAAVREASIVVGAETRMPLTMSNVMIEAVRDELPVTARAAAVRPSVGATNRGRLLAVPALPRGWSPSLRIRVTGSRFDVAWRGPD